MVIRPGISRCRRPRGCYVGNVTWRPLLEGELALEAARAVDEISRCLSPADDPWLASGAAGQALLFHYLGRTAAKEAALDAALDGVARTAASPGFIEGFTGVAWTAEHVGDGEDVNAEVDQALESVLASGSMLAHDHLSGLIGVGVYFLERWPRPAAARALATLVRILAARARRSESGAFWWTPPAFLPETTRRRYPEGHGNLGLAHGVPAAIVFLARCGALGIEEAVARELVASSARWLLSKRLTGGSSRFGFHVLPGDEVEPTAARANWCYGDPGVGAALWQAGRSAGLPALCDEGLELMSATAGRDPGDCGIDDAGLCHGAAGLAHMLNRLHQESGDSALGQAARLWFARTLALRRPGQGVAGFLALSPAPSGGLQPTAEPGFLIGAAGVALALVAATSAIEPRWDRALLLSTGPS
jgi:hypothetical protein